MTCKIFLAIYWQALQLWWKRIPYVPHPRSRLRDPDWQRDAGRGLIGSTASDGGSDAAVKEAS